MQCKDVEALVEQEGLSPLPGDIAEHLSGCRDCRNFLADLNSIVDVARKMPAEITPPDRVWISLRAQLEAEGIIREPAVPVTVDRAPWWQTFADLFKRHGLATAAVGLLIVAAALVQLRTNNVQLRTDKAGTAATASLSASSATHVATLASTENSFQATRTALNEQEPVAQGMILSSNSPVDQSLLENLRKVDEFIAECERRVSAEPHDQLAREYLAEAYQQKAILLSAMLDRGRSIN